MLRRRFTKLSVGLILGAGFLGAGFLGTSFLGMKEADGAPKPPAAPTDTGLIYFWHGGAPWVMSPDGSGKAQLGTPLYYLAEPSKALHAGQQWFLQAQPVDGAYPDGRPRIELFAVSRAGAPVQLTDDPSIQPSVPQGSDPSSWYGYFARPRWANREGIVDGKVSYLGRRWGTDTDGNPAVIEYGMYVLALDPETLGIHFVAGFPARVPVDDFPLSTDWDNYGPIWTEFGPTPSFLYDWSPDGAMIVHETAPAGLRVVDSTSGTFYLLRSSGMNPRWSPVRSDGTTRIVCIEFGDGSSVHTVLPDGTGDIALASYTNPSSINGSHVAPNFSTVFSPHGSHVIYTVTKVSHMVIVSHKIYSVSATGGPSKVLTSELDFSVPLGWTSNAAP
jgi:hypothetical protein